MTVNENIRPIRQERNLTQRQLEEMICASEAYIRAYESGRRNPRPSSLEKYQMLYLSILKYWQILILMV